MEQYITPNQNSLTNLGKIKIEFAKESFNFKNICKTNGDLHINFNKKLPLMQNLEFFSKLLSNHLQSKFHTKVGLKFKSPSLYAQVLLQKKLIFCMKFYFILKGKF